MPTKTRNVRDLTYEVRLLSTLKINYCFNMITKGNHYLNLKKKSLYTLFIYLFIYFK